MLARIGFAKVDFILAPFTIITLLAFAYVFVESVLTGAPVETRIGGTLVDVRLASRTVKTTGTLAFVTSHHINTLPAIFTGVAGTFIDVDLAVASSVSWVTTALKNKSSFSMKTLSSQQ